MPTDGVALTRSYLGHLTTADRALLLAGAGEGGADRGSPGPLGEPGAIQRLLSQPAVFDAVFGAAGPTGAGSGQGSSGQGRSGQGGSGEGGSPQGGSGQTGRVEPLLGASPFLVFAVAVARSADDLASATHVLEWLGPGKRAPVFDVAPLREFLAAPWQRLFLAELLASYTHVASGSVMVSTRRGWRRQRFSELDPVRLAALLEVVPDAERPGILRRLGDLALFLTGVFPDHLARQGFGPVEEGRLLRAGGLPAAREQVAAGRPAWSLGDAGAVGLLELLGQRWYRAAFDGLIPPVPAAVAVLGDLPARFGQARRILNLVTDRFLFGYRDQWFGPARG